MIQQRNGAPIWAQLPGKLGRHARETLLNHNHAVRKLGFCLKNRKVFRESNAAPALTRASCKSVKNWLELYRRLTASARFLIYASDMRSFHHVIQDVFYGDRNVLICVICVTQEFLLMFLGKVYFL